MIFYKFLSDNEVNYLKSIGWTDEDIVTLVEDHDNQEAVMMMEYCRNNIGYFIEYKNLFGTWLKPNSDTVSKSVSRIKEKSLQIFRFARDKNNKN